MHLVKIFILNLELESVHFYQLWLPKLTLTPASPSKKCKSFFGLLVVSLYLKAVNPVHYTNTLFLFSVNIKTNVYVLNYYTLQPVMMTNNPWCLHEISYSICLCLSLLPLSSTHAHCVNIMAVILNVKLAWAILLGCWKWSIDRSVWHGPRAWSVKQIVLYIFVF